MYCMCVVICLRAGHIYILMRSFDLTLPDCIAYMAGVVPYISIHGRSGTIHMQLNVGVVASKTAQHHMVHNR